MTDIKDVLTKMISTCQALKSCFDQDANHFIKRDMDSLTHSDKNKLDLLNELHTTLQTLQTHLATLPGPLMEKLKGYIQQSEPAQKSQINQLMEKLQQEVIHCLQAMTVNSKIILSNLEFIRQFYDKVCSRMEANIPLYDQSGHISK